MSPRRLFLLALLALVPTSARAQAPTWQEPVQRVLEQLRALARDPALIQAVKAQNARKVPPPAIQKLDVQWRASSGTPDFMRPYLDNTCVTALRRFQQRLPAVADAFVMDDQGALVAATQRTSDYWQGDEAKWLQAFASGRGAEFIAPPEFDDSLQVYAVQVSLPVLEAGRPIGVLTVSLSLDVLL
jgi:hypothetical protein